MSDERSPYLVVFGAEEPATPTPVEELADWARAQVRQWHRSTDQNRKAGAKMVEEIADRAVNAHAGLVEALEVMTDHAGEKYPHFESERGQRDIKQAQAVLAKAREVTDG